MKPATVVINRMIHRKGKRVASATTVITGSFQFDITEKGSWCPGEGCPDEHKNPMLHTLQSGWCANDSHPRQHRICKGLSVTYGGRKKIACPCKCHGNGIISGKSSDNSKTSSNVKRRKR